MASSTRLDKQPRRRRPRFWLGPLVAGGCVALGYGVTQRFLILQSSWQKPGEQTFELNSFPGDRLQLLRNRHGQAAVDLQADVAAFESEEAGKRKLSEVAEKLAAEARRREQDLQASLLKPVPAITPSTWKPSKPADPEFVSPQNDLSEPLTTDGDSQPLEAESNSLVQPDPAAKLNPVAEPNPADQPNPGLQPIPESAYTPAVLRPEPASIQPASTNGVAPQANGLNEFMGAPMQVFEADAPLQAPPPAETNQPMPTLNIQPAAPAAPQEAVLTP